MSTTPNSDLAKQVRFGLIKQSVQLRGLTFAGIARDLRVHRSMITLVAKGQRVSKRIQKALARACNKKYRELWA